MARADSITYCLGTKRLIVQSLSIFLYNVTTSLDGLARLKFVVHCKRQLTYVRNYTLEYTSYCELLLSGYLTEQISYA